MFLTDKRVKLEKGEQHILMQKLRAKYGTMVNVSKEVGLKYSVLKKYSQEKLLLPESFFNSIIKILNLNKQSIQFCLLDSNWGRVKGARFGMASLEKRYPKKILEWRKKARINSAKSRLKIIKISKFDENFAELIGIYLGDGTLTKYFIKISGDSRYDLSYFKYIQNLFLSVFGINSKISNDKKNNSLYLTVFSKSLCTYFNDILGLKYGDKMRNNSLIPYKIIKNSYLALACLRGLIDTDGSISRRGEQFTITFYSQNENLSKQVYSICKKFELFTFISKDNKTIGTNSKSRIVKYFKVVGSSNLRHIVRFCEWNNHNLFIYREDVTKYYQKSLYRDMNLPFKTAL